MKIREQRNKFLDQPILRTKSQNEKVEGTKIKKPSAVQSLLLQAVNDYQNDSVLNMKTDGTTRKRQPLLIKKRVMSNLEPVN